MILVPKLFTTLRGYTRAQFLSDLTAGLIVGIVAIPLAIAFGIASGVSPEKGLVTAVVAGFLISALGGSRVQIGGPTGAFVVIVYGIVEKFGVQGLILATFMAGIILVLMGLAKFGAAVKFIPHTVIVGFTSGIAVIIFSSEVKDFLGLNTGAGALPADFVDKWRVLVAGLSTVNWDAVALASLTVLVIALWPKICRRIPGALVALVLTSLLVAFFKLPVETIGSRFGELPHMLPRPSLPGFDWGMLESLIQPAFTIAILGAVESLLSAVVSDGMIGGRHRSNMELIGQGIANIGSSLFGGMPATGALARTVTNIKNGGRTPVAGIIHSITLLAALFFLARWIKLIPLACLAGILIVVAYHMSEWRSFKELLQSSRGAVAVLLATFFITILIDLTVAIEIGLVLSSFIFINRMANLTNVSFVTDEIREDEKEEDRSIAKVPVPPGVEVYEINGPFFFGAANKFEEAIRVVAKKPKVRILRLRNVPLIDSTGLHALKGFYHKCQKNGIALLITGLHVQPLNEMVKSELYELLGEENIFGSIYDALKHAKKFLD